MSRRRWAIGIASVVAFCLGVLLTRVIYDGRHALGEGDAAFAKKDYPEAITRWRRAARWYAPGAPHVAGAYEKLESLARLAEADNKPELALSAWRAIRSSSKATRSFFTPYKDKLALANEHIAALSARFEGPRAAPGESQAQRKKWHLDLLRKSEAPSVAWSLLALLGFATWIGGGFLLAWRGVDQDDKINRRLTLMSVGVITCGLAVWLTGLYLA